MNIRTVIEEDAATFTIDAETEIYQRLESAFDALKWWLAHRPESGEAIDEDFWLYKQAGDRDQNIPALVALYRFDSNCVVIISVLVQLPSL